MFYLFFYANSHFFKVDHIIPSLSLKLIFHKFSNEYRIKRSLLHVEFKIFDVFFCVKTAFINVKNFCKMSTIFKTNSDILSSNHKKIEIKFLFFIFVTDNLETFLETLFYACFLIFLFFAILRIFCLCWYVRKWYENVAKRILKWVSKQTCKQTIKSNIFLGSELLVAIVWCIFFGSKKQQFRF